MADRRTSDYHVRYIIPGSGPVRTGTQTAMSASQAMTLFKMHNPRVVVLSADIHHQTKGFPGAWEL